MTRLMDNIKAAGPAVKPIQAGNAEIPRQDASADCGRNIYRPRQTPRRTRLSRRRARATPRGRFSGRPDPLPMPMGRDTIKKYRDLM